MSGKRIVLAASRTESNERDQDCWVQMLYATLPSKVAHYLTDLNCLRNELREDGQARYVPRPHVPSAALEQEGLILKEVFE